MKKTISLLLGLCLLCAALAGCGGKKAGVPAAGAAGEKRLSIVTTVFPIWDWTRNLWADNAAGATLVFLLDSGVDMHSYQPAVDDIIAISTCDLLIYIGGESDAWVAGALKEAVNPDLIAVNLMEVLGDEAKLEETVEGMQKGGEEEDEYDEHIWLSPRNAQLCCAAITEALTRLDPERGDAYAAAAAAYGEKLAALDAAYRAAAEDAGRDTLLFADRFPFRYLLDDYGISYYAAFSGCEAETEASFETIRFLAGKAVELELSAILTTESPIPRLAETVVENTEKKNAEILALDSMQSVGGTDAESGASYLGVMGKNLEVLREALR